MNTISLKLTVNATLELLSNTAVSPATRDEIKNCIIQAWSVANGVAIEQEELDEIDSLDSDPEYDHAGLDDQPVHFKIS